MKKQALYMAPAIEVTNMVEEEMLLADSEITEVKASDELGIGSDVLEDVEGWDANARTLIHNLFFN